MRCGLHCLFDSLRMFENNSLCKPLGLVEFEKVNAFTRRAYFFDCKLKVRIERIPALLRFVDAGIDSAGAIDEKVMCVGIAFVIASSFLCPDVVFGIHGASWMGFSCAAPLHHIGQM